MPRLFTLKEALAILPDVRELVVRARKQGRDYADAERQLASAVATVRGNGHSGRALREAQERMARSSGKFQRTIQDLESLGCEIKDLEMGLVDFRSSRDGREVYLCWRLGEDTIAYWHELDAGFTGRQPLG